MKIHIYIATALIAGFLVCAFPHPHAAQAKVYSEDEANDNDGNDNGDNDKADTNDNGDNDKADMNDNGNDNDTDNGEEDQELTPPPAPHKTAPAIVPVTPAPVPAQAPVQQPPTPAYMPSAPLAPSESPGPSTPPVHPHSHPMIPARAPATTPAAAPEPPPASGNWWHPHPGLKWQIQYAGRLDPKLDVKAYDLDLVDTDPAIIQQLKSRGIKVICYFSAGSFEAWRPDAHDFPASVQGQPNGWKGEKWLDIRKIDILKPIMQKRIDLAVQKGCDAVDPDNVEAYDNKSGFPLTAKDQIAYNKMIAELAHAAGLAVSLKNDPDQIPQLLPYFDFAVSEQCFEYQSCDQLEPFIKAGKPVFDIEYKGTTAAFCPKANKLNFDTVKKDLDLDAKIDWCR